MIQKRGHKEHGGSMWPTVFVVVVLAAAAGAYYYYRKRREDNVLPLHGIRAPLRLDTDDDGPSAETFIQNSDSTDSLPALAAGDVPYLPRAQEEAEAAQASKLRSLNASPLPRSSRSSPAPINQPYTDAGGNQSEDPLGVSVNSSSKPGSKPKKSKSSDAGDSDSDAGNNTNVFSIADDDEE